MPHTSSFLITLHCACLGALLRSLLTLLNPFSLFHYPYSPHRLRFHLTFFFSQEDKTNCVIFIPPSHLFAANLSPPSCRVHPVSPRSVLASVLPSLSPSIPLSFIIPCLPPSLSPSVRPNPFIPAVPPPVLPFYPSSALQFFFFQAVEHNDLVFPQGEIDGERDRNGQCHSQSDL